MAPKVIKGIVAEVAEGMSPKVEERFAQKVAVVDGFKLSEMEITEKVGGLESSEVEVTVMVDVLELSRAEGFATADGNSGK